jgi:hypothetical protein
VFKKIRPFLFALALIAVTCGLRWPGLGKLVWNLDEGSTFTMGEIVRHGGVMYRNAADNRTPLVPYAKALIFSVIGDWNIRGAHIVLALMLGLTAIWLWQLARQARDEKAGVMAAVYFTFISFVMMGPVDAMAAHTGWFLIFLSALGMWAFVTALKRGSGTLALGAGALFALAALAKQPGLLDWGVCVVLCGLTAWTTPERRRDCVKLAAMLAVGFAAVLVGTYCYFAANHAWKDFLQYSWYYNTQLYVPEVPFRERLLGIRTPFFLTRENTPFALGLAIVAVPWLLCRTLPELSPRTKRFSVLPWLILGWLASGLISTIISGRDFAHYSIQLMPGLSLACGWVTARLWEKFGATSATGPGWRKITVRGIIAFGLLSLTWTSVRRASTFDLSDGISKDIGLVIKARTRPTDRMFVWGYEPELHVFSQRLPNTRFIYAVFLTGLIPWTNLDALKNTDYAIVPGAWDAFWKDFTRRPPAIIVDTHGNRGFLKYPLRKQTRLWEIVQKDYIEVEIDYAKARGYHIYQRAESAPAPADLAQVPVDSRVQLASPEHSGPETLLVSVDTPVGTTAVDLYLDGQAYRRVENLGGAPLQSRFFVLGSDLPLGRHTLQAVARGSHDEASKVAMVTIAAEKPGAEKFAGPPLRFAGKKILPVESETLDGQPVNLLAGTDEWNADAPSRLVYPRPDGLTQLDFTFGMRPGAYDGSQPQNTDGIDVSVFFEDGAGKSTQLYRRHVDPVRNSMDRVRLSSHVDVPGFTGGRLIFLITPGPMNNPAFDWSYWVRIDGDPPALQLHFRGQPVPPVELQAEFGVTLMDFRKQKVLLIHAPSHFGFRDQPGMTELSGHFGMLDESWNGPKQSNGAVFEVEQIMPDHAHRLLFSHRLYPGNKPDDRGMQAMRVKLPYVEGSIIRLSTRAANPADNSFNYTFWQDLDVGEFSAQLAFEGKKIDSIHSEAMNGFDNLEEDGAKVLFAHAPSEIVFPLEAGAKQLGGKIGLVRGAYTGKGDTDGVVFVVETETIGGVRKELFRRYLNPREHADDRGAVPFEVSLPDEPGGKLILRTEAAPSGRVNFAWSYWRELRLTRLESKDR